MGAGQALALQPGVSRSGVTITVGRFMGLGRDGAARFAFLMSLPITAGALLFKWFDVQGEGGIPADFRAPFLWGIVASGVTGYIAVWGTLKLIPRTRSLPSCSTASCWACRSCCCWPRRSGSYPPARARTADPWVTARAVRAASSTGTATVTASSPTWTTVARSTTGNAGGS